MNIHTKEKKTFPSNGLKTFRRWTDPILLAALYASCGIRRDEYISDIQIEQDGVTVKIETRPPIKA